MTAIEKVKRRLWMSQYKVQDMTEHRFIQGYDLVVENIYRVAVRTKDLSDVNPLKVDVLAVVKAGKITFYKEPHIVSGKLLDALIADTSPLNIFIKYERQKQHNNTGNKRARPQAKKS